MVNNIRQQFMDITLKRENWFYCDVCDCISYRYGCECYGTACNAGGCDKCKSIWDIVTDAIKQGNHPSEKILKREVIDNYKNYLLKKEYKPTKTTEDIVFEEMGMSPPSIFIEIARQEISASYGKQQSTT